MRAVVLTGPGRAEVQDVPPPTPASGDVVVDVDRAGVCGTDTELFSGEMAYLQQGLAQYPLRPGHEWCGRVVEIGDGVDARWIGRRVVGDTMLGDGTCRRCRLGRQHLCEARDEVGIRGGRPGALAEQLAVPASSLHALPDTVDGEVGALVEPGGNAFRAARAAAAGPGTRVLVQGPGTIGLLTAMFLQADGADVHLLGRPADLPFARSLGFAHVWTQDTLPALAFDAVVDASNAEHLPALALDLVEPGGQLVFIGLAGSPSQIDTRLLALKDVTAVGILSASPGLDGAIAAYADGTVNPRPLISATVGLEEVADVLAGRMPREAGGAPKVLVDPRRS